MSQIEELQARIMTAMDRIGAGVEGAAAAAGTVQPEPDADLVQALDEEKLANAQLEERLRSLKERHAAELTAAQAAATPPEDDGSKALLEQQVSDQDRKITDQAAQMAALDTDLQRLREANKQLREANDALRQANEAGVGEPHLINKAMLVELEGLRATQAADAAEVTVVMERLNSLLSNARDLPEGEEA